MKADAEKDICFNRNRLLSFLPTTKTRIAAANYTLFPIGEHQIQFSRSLGQAKWQDSLAL
jgi:hypothetical protein